MYPMQKLRGNNADTTHGIYRLYHGLQAKVVCKMVPRIILLIHLIPKIPDNTGADATHAPHC